jgi:signal transduction histidine kinase
MLIIELNRRSGDNSNKIVSFLHIFIDNTEREKLKYEKTLREYQRMMLSSVAHEFRNPLNAIQGNLQLIELNNDPKIEKYVKISRSSCTLLNSYVEDILDLGRIEGSAFQLNCDEFSIKDVLDEVYDIFEIELKRK